MFDSPLVWFAFVIPVIVAVIFAIWIRRKQDATTHPSMIATLPLCLISVAILQARSSFTLLRSFQEIATRRSAGLSAVIEGVRNAREPLAWGFLVSAVSIVVVILVAAVFRSRRDAETPLIHASISLPALIITAALLLFLFLLAITQYSNVDLVMMICDKNRGKELAAQFGNVSPGFFAARISASFVSTFFLSICEALGLLAAGVMDLLWRQTQSPRQVFAVLLTVGTLIASVVSALNEFGLLNSLQHTR